jgi:hypothetical protein
MKLKILVLIIAALFLASCVAKEDDSTAASFLVINSLTGNDLTGTAGSTTVFSDVLTTSGSIINDNGVATVTATLFDPATVDKPTAYQNIVVDEIDIEFMRTDGKNVEGVDVPYRFTQPINIVAEVATEAEIPFVLIRHVAKLETPLLELRDWVNQEKILQLVAKVTLQGKDVAGHRISPVSGYLSVWCSNFADED